VNTIDEFVTLVQTEVGLAVTAEHIERGFDQVPGWDSVHLLTLMLALERQTGRPIPLPDLLEAPCLGHIYRLVTRP
jgi:acyl carrier protein